MVRKKKKETTEQVITEDIRKRAIILDKPGVETFAGERASEVAKGINLNIEEREKSKRSQEMFEKKEKEEQQRRETQPTKIQPQENLILPKEEKKTTFFERPTPRLSDLTKIQSPFDIQPTIAQSAVAGAATGATVAGAGALGLSTAIKGLFGAIGAVAGTDTIATWAAVDNYASSIPFQLNQVVGAAREGSIDPITANNLISQAERQLEQATEYVNTSTRINPLLWAARKRYQALLDKLAVDIELAKIRFTAEQRR